MCHPCPSCISSRHLPSPPLRLDAPVFWPRSLLRGDSIEQISHLCIHSLRCLRATCARFIIWLVFAAGVCCSPLPIPQCTRSQAAAVASFLLLSACSCHGVLSSFLPLSRRLAVLMHVAVPVAHWLQQAPLGFLLSSRHDAPRRGAWRRCAPLACMHALCQRTRATLRAVTDHHSAGG